MSIAWWMSSALLLHCLAVKAHKVLHDQRHHNTHSWCVKPEWPCQVTQDSTAAHTRLTGTCASLIQLTHWHAMQTRVHVIGDEALQARCQAQLDLLAELLMDANPGEALVQVEAALRYVSVTQLPLMDTATSLTIFYKCYCRAHVVLNFCGSASPRRYMKHDIGVDNLKVLQGVSLCCNACQAQL